MKSFATALLVASASAVTLNQYWPSVARCNGDHTSSDINACDHDNRMAHKHDNVVTLQTNQEWPSVARCNGDHTSSDINACDHDNRMAHKHDNVVTLQTNQEWPSVARCNGDHTSSDINACDHDNRMAHKHDNVVTLQTNNMVQLSEEYRPVIKCIDPVHGNPISCDHDDITSFAPLAKDENGFTPTKVVLGGPSFNGEQKAAVDAPAAKE